MHISSNFTVMLAIKLLLILHNDYSGFEVEDTPGKGYAG